MGRKHIFKDTAITMVGGILLTSAAFYLLEVLTGNQEREAALKQEIAHNLATKWNDCASARRWVADFKCSSHR